MTNPTTSAPAKSSKKSKASEVLASTATPAPQTGATETAPETITVQLPLKGTDGKPSRITKETVIAPPHSTTGNKERWFQKSRLVGFSKDATTGQVSIIIKKSDLSYRGMLND